MTLIRSENESYGLYLATGLKTNHLIDLSFDNTTHEARVNIYKMYDPIATICGSNNRRLIETALEQTIKK